jgi:hypothetical protein
MKLKSLICHTSVTLCLQNSTEQNLLSFALTLIYRRSAMAIRTIRLFSIVSAVGGLLVSFWFLAVVKFRLTYLWPFQAMPKMRHVPQLPGSEALSGLLVCT